MLEQKMVDALNAQIYEELNSAYLYAAMAADCEAKNLKGAAAWFKAQFGEEQAHAWKLYGYMNNQGHRTIFKAIPEPQAEWANLLAAFEAALAHEKYISGKIRDLVKLAKDLDDYASESFLQWFITEQVEEEASAEEVVTKIKMVGDAPHVLYMLDKELGARGAG